MSSSPVFVPVLGRDDNATTTPTAATIQLHTTSDRDTSTAAVADAVEGPGQSKTARRRSLAGSVLALLPSLGTAKSARRQSVHGSVPAQHGLVLGTTAAVTSDTSLSRGRSPFPSGQDATRQPGPSTATATAERSQAEAPFSNGPVPRRARPMSWLSVPLGFRTSLDRESHTEIAGSATVDAAPAPREWRHSSQCHPYIRAEGTPSPLEAARRYCSAVRTQSRETPGEDLEATMPIGPPQKAESPASPPLSISLKPQREGSTVYLAGGTLGGQATILREDAQGRRLVSVKAMLRGVALSSALEATEMTVFGEPLPPVMVERQRTLFYPMSVLYRSSAPERFEVLPQSTAELLKVPFEFKLPATIRAVREQGFGIPLSRCGPAPVPPSFSIPKKSGPEDAQATGKKVAGILKSLLVSSAGEPKLEDAFITITYSVELVAKWRMPGAFAGLRAKKDKISIPVEIYPQAPAGPQTLAVPPIVGREGSHQHVVANAALYWTSSLQSSVQHTPLKQWSGMSLFQTSRGLQGFDTHSALFDVGTGAEPMHLEIKFCLPATTALYLGSSIRFKLRYRGHPHLVFTPKRSSVKLDLLRSVQTRTRHGALRIEQNRVVDESMASGVREGSEKHDVSTLVPRTSNVSSASSSPASGTSTTAPAEESPEQPSLRTRTPQKRRVVEIRSLGRKAEGEDEDEVPPPVDEYGGGRGHHAVVGAGGWHCFGGTLRIDPGLDGEGVRIPPSFDFDGISLQYRLALNLRFTALPTAGAAGADGTSATSRQPASFELKLMTPPVRIVYDPTKVVPREEPTRSHFARPMSAIEARPERPLRLSARPASAYGPVAGFGHREGLPELAPIAPGPALHEEPGEAEVHRAPAATTVEAASDQPSQSQLSSGSGRTIGDPHSQTQGIAAFLPRSGDGAVTPVDRPSTDVAPTETSSGTATLDGAPQRTRMQSDMAGVHEELDEGSQVTVDGSQVTVEGLARHVLRSQASSVLEPPVLASSAQELSIAPQDRRLDSAESVDPRLTPLADSQSESSFQSAREASSSRSSPRSPTFRGAGASLGAGRRVASDRGPPPAREPQQPLPPVPNSSSTAAPVQPSETADSLVSYSAAIALDAVPSRRPPLAIHGGAEDERSFSATSNQTSATSGNFPLCTSSCDTTTTDARLPSYSDIGRMYRHERGGTRAQGGAGRGL